MIGVLVLLTIAIVLALLLGLAGPRTARFWRAYGAATLLASLWLLRSPLPAVEPDLLRYDALSLAWQALILIGALPLLLLSRSQSEVPVVLALASVLGMSLVATANHLFVLFLGFELMSLPLYILVFDRRRPASLEAAIKYFFSGSVAAGIFLFGLSAYYGQLGSAAFASQALLRTAASPAAIAIASVLMCSAALFKIGAFPLHFWLPDAYEAAAPELTGFMSTAVKAAGFLMLIRLLSMAGDSAQAVVRALPWLAAATMTVGNFLALRQKRLQRLLAYSSLSHAGYILAGVWAWARLGAVDLRAVYFYLGAYTLMNWGAFIFVRLSGIVEIDQLRGYAARSPALAAFFCLMLLSLAGVPPTAGFLAKFFIFWDVMRAGGIALLVCMALNSVVGLAYYFMLMRDAVFDRPRETLAPAAFTIAARALVYGCAAGTLLLGLTPGAIEWISTWTRI